MKALLLLAATSLSAIAVLPHMPDMTTVKNEVDTLAANVPNPLPQISKLIAPAQPDQAAPTPQADQSTPPEDNSSDPSATPAPVVAKASPEDVQRSYGQPERVERTVYGETWYYPVYIFYFRNGYVQRTMRSNGSNVRTPFVSTSTGVTPHTQPQPWRFSSHSSLGNSPIGGSGVQRPSSYVPRQPSGVAPTASSSYHPANGSSAGSGASCNHSTQTVTNFHPPVTHTAPVQRTAPVVTTGYNRVGY